MENERNLVKYTSILDSINESSTYDDFDDVSISTNSLRDIRDRKYIHPYINAINSRLKTCDRIRQTQNELKGA